MALFHYFIAIGFFLYWFRPQCFPISIPSDDPHFDDSCMEFVRSAPSPPGDGCQLGIDFEFLYIFRTTWILWSLSNIDFFSKSLSYIKLINTFCKYIFFFLYAKRLLLDANQTNLTPEYIPKFTLRAYFGFFFGSTF